MRIPTTQTYLNQTAAFSHQKGIQEHLIQQLSTQKRINTPSDDPVAAARVLDTRQAQSRNQQFIANSQMVDSALEFTETAMGEMNNLLIQMKTLAISAGNGSFGSENMKQIGADFAKKIEAFAGVVNSTDGQGRYLFSGTKANTPPYQFTPVTADTTDTQLKTAFKYQGNDGQKTVQVGPQRFIAISEPASAFLGMDSAPPQSTPNPGLGAAPTNEPNILHGMVKFARDLLKGDGSGFKDAISTIDRAMGQISSARASAGARRLESEQGRELGKDVNLIYEKSILELEGVDIAKVSAELSVSKMALEASHLSFAKIKGLSLFNYI